MEHLFTLILFFSIVDNPKPLFGKEVKIEIRTESKEACEALKSMVNKQLLVNGMRFTVSECK